MTSLRGEADDLLDLLGHLLRIGAGEIDLVDHRDDGEVVLQGQVDVGQRLRLDALGGVDHQQRALAGGQAAGDLVGEVHVAGSVDQIELVLHALRVGVGHADGLGLDGDALLALQVHRVEHLVGHLARVDGAGALQQPVGQGRLAVVDVGDDAEVPDSVLVSQ